MRSRHLRTCQLGLLALCAVGFALRLIELDARSLWLDEGFSLLRIWSSWSDILANQIFHQTIPTVDLHPPLYFALAKAWGELAGHTVFGWRSFSAFCSTLIIPATAVLTQRLVRRRSAAFMAASLAMLAPTYLWQAAEVRMYALTTLLGALSSYAALRVLSHRFASIRWLIGWSALCIGSFLTHYSLLLPLTLQLAFLSPRILACVRLRRGHHQLLLSMVALIGLMLIAILGRPTLDFIIGYSGGALSSTKQPVPLLEVGREFIADSVNALTFGLNAADPTGGSLLWATVALILFGWLTTLRQRRRHTYLWIILAVAPLLGWLIASSRLENRPSFRYVVYTFPLFHAAIASAVGSGFAALPRSKALVGFPLLVLSLVPPAFGAWMTHVRTDVWQDDWRGLATFLRQNLRRDDGVLLGLHASEASLRYYLGQPMDFFETAGQWRDTSANTAGDLLAQRYGRLWVVLAGDLEDYWNRFVVQIAEQGFTYRQEVAFPARTTSLRVRLYDRSAWLDQLPPEAHVAATSDGALAGLSFIAPDLRYERPALGLIAYWRRSQRAPAYLSVRLSHDNAVWYDFRIETLLGQPAAQPGAPLSHRIYLPLVQNEEQSKQRPAPLSAMRYTLPLWPGLPPLPYVLTLTLTDAQGDVLQRETWTLDVTEVERWVRWPRLATASLWESPALSLLQAEYLPSLSEGEDMPVVLTWSARQPLADGWRIRLALSGSGEAQVERPLAAHPWPPAHWPLGEAVRDQYLVPSASLSEGRYWLTLYLEREGQAAQRHTLGRVTIVPASPIEVTPNYAITVTAAHVGPLTLQGYSITEVQPEAGVLVVETFWRVEARPQEDGRLFVHLFDAAGNFIGQDDGPPFNGARRTQSLRPGQWVRQVHTIRTGAALQPGVYHLRAGIYTAATLRRWPATQNGVPAPDDVVVLSDYVLPASP
ncbi:MAG: hypothetical protein D6709_00835 [Chloroflexi bacterium]|uniref:glycosyltransferase family 39 protein n=1 Tax=Candidatus Roseilinea sp. NK_OTU-006 TaxID=2704250 RepID=UPI000F151B1C|nr:glycosyltransferase family 39 protein [Candidatus Roseilinea sp. NK_OTU-006]RMG66095.1 MAG: hypothetical protein D6709_00835 [Chloroflexota bacterium]